MTAYQLATLVLEALEVGDISTVEALARSTVEDGRVLDIHGRRHRCPECGVVGWPGELENHLHERQAA